MLATKKKPILNLTTHMLKEDAEGHHESRSGHGNITHGGFQNKVLPETKRDRPQRRKSRATEKA